MADVDVQFGAQISGLLSGLSQVTSGIQDTVAKSQAPLEGLVGTFNKLQGAIIAVASGYAFKELVQGAVESTNEIVKLSKAMGGNLEEASIVRAQLVSLGITTDDYREASAALTRQVRLNEADLRAFGVTTRDSNGRLLDQQAMMTSAVNWLLKYKEGTDRVIAAQTAFGRGAGDTVLNLTKMTAQTRLAGEQVARSLGSITTPEDAANVKAYQYQMRVLGLTFEAIRDTIGNAVLPYLTKFAAWFNEQGPKIVSTIKEQMPQIISYALDLVSTLANFGISVLEVLEKVGAGFDRLKYRASSAAVGAGAGAAVGMWFGGLGAVPGAALGGLAGWLVGGIDDAATKGEAATKKFDGMRAELQKSIEATRKLLMSGGPAAPSTPNDQPPQGTKSASGLINPQGQMQAALIAAEGQLAVRRAQFDREKMLLDAGVAAFKISEDQKYQRLLEITDQEYALERGLLERKLALASRDVAATAKVKNELLLLEQKHETDVQRIRQQSYAAQQQIVAGYVGTVENSWNGSLRSMLAGTMSFGQAVKGIVADLVVYWIQQLGKKLIFEKLTAALTTAIWGSQKTAEVGITAAAEAAKTGAVVAGEGARTAATEAGFLTRLGSMITEALAFIGTKLAEAFAGLVAAFSFLGPLAVPAALGVVGGASALAIGMLPKFETGAYKIPKVMPALLHPGERVLNAEEAARSRGERGDGGGLGGGGNTYHLSFLDGAGVKDFINRHIDKLAPAVANYQRKNPAARGAW